MWASLKSRPQLLRTRGNKCKRWNLCWKSTRRWLRSYQHLLFSHDCNFPWDRWHEIWIERRLSVLTWPRAFASCYIFGFKENHFFFLLKKLSGQTLTSWVDRSGLAQYFRITKRGKSKHLLVGIHLFVNSKCWHAHKDLKQCPPLEYSTFCHFSWMSPNFKSMHMSWNKSYVIYKSNRASFLGPQDKYCLSVGLICWTTMVIGNHFKSERSRISIVGHKLTAGLEPYFANSQRVEAAKLLYGAHFER